MKTFIDHVLEDLNKYRRMMEAEHAELVHMLPNRDGVASEKSPDDLDEVQ